MPHDLSRLAIHTMTTKPWSLAQCLDGYAAAGVGGITVWRNVIADVGAAEAARMIRASGLRVPAVVRGGFFPAESEATRRAALDDNRRALDEAAAVGASMVVLVCGAVPGMPLGEARRQIADGLAAVLPHAESVSVKLAIEPLHPMYAADRSAVNTMRQARELCERLRHPLVGIAVDVYHVWWDPDVEAEIARAGEQGTLFAFHLCDWRVNTRDLLNDRGLMGDGCIDLKRLAARVRAAGFDGWDEVEIFSTEQWATDQTEYVERIKRAYREHC